VALCEEFGAHLIVDEAHSTGIYGKQGEGLVVSLGLEGRIFARLHTFGKAMGAHGAVWIGSAILKDYLINYCRSFIYTTALPAHSIAHIQSAYTFLSENPERIALLHQKIQLFKKLILQNNIEAFISSDSPIQSCIVPGNNNVKAVTSIMQENGFDVRPILHPTVTEGKERIRICLHTYNSDNEITQLVHILKIGLSKLS
jgi:8-amino-7-oxononanoate synthase